MIYLEIYIFVGGFIRVVILALPRFVVLARRRRPYVFILPADGRMCSVYCLVRSTSPSGGKRRNCKGF